VHRERVAPETAFARPWPEPAERSVWVVEPTRPALVLGSTQAQPVARPHPWVDVVRRRSGGGAVLVEPGRLVWADVLVPAGDPLADADVGRAFAWLGRAWAHALGDAGVAGASVHDGPLVHTPWSRAVCFAGRGPGEVTVGGAKVVGMCARRSRAGALFQCAALLAWDPRPLVELLGLPPRAIVDLAGAATGAAVEADVLIGALVAGLP
jgi:lipoate-protein ligase A